MSPRRADAPSSLKGSAPRMIYLRAHMYLLESRRQRSGTVGGLIASLPLRAQLACSCCWHRLLLQQHAYANLTCYESGQKPSEIAAMLARDKSVLTCLLCKQATAQAGLSSPPPCGLVAASLAWTDCASQRPENGHCSPLEQRWTPQLIVYIIRGWT